MEGRIDWMLDIVSIVCHDHLDAELLYCVFYTKSINYVYNLEAKVRSINLLCCFLRAHSTEVHQVTDEAKAEVSEEARRAANEIAKNELSRRLAQIDMSEGQFEAYEGFLNPIINQVDELKLILASLEGKQNERTWLKHQQVGMTYMRYFFYISI